MTVFISLFYLVALGCNNKSNKGYTKGSYYDTKSTLQEKEQDSPLDFLTTDGTYRKNFLGEWVLEGTITNKATIVTYKDITIKIKFYSKTGKLIGTKKETLYEYFKPMKMKKFKIKVNGFKNTKSIGWDIINASYSN